MILDKMSDKVAAAYAHEIAAGCVPRRNLGYPFVKYRR